LTWTYAPTLKKVPPPLVKVLVVDTSRIFQNSYHLELCFHTATSPCSSCLYLQQERALMVAWTSLWSKA